MILAFVLVLMAFLSGGGAQFDLDIPPIPSEFEPRCIFSGLTFLKGCEAEIVKMVDSFDAAEIDRGLTKNGEASGVLEGFLNSPDGRPSKQCCLSFCSFNNDLCSCEPNARNYTASIFGSVESYHYLLGFYTEQCGTVDLYQDCPQDPTNYALNKKKLNVCEEEILFAPEPEPDAIEDMDYLNE
ncbi:hypothetical protein BSKO_01298 [Bryopsis sp. KO-2023]|nr:hypothetical protein BSKO_01298 [Bryopsis sp. KO-2023]